MFLFAVPFLAAIAAIVAAVVFIITFAFVRVPAPGANRFGMPSPTGTPVQAVERGFLKGLDIWGRASRLDFWTFAIFIGLFCLLPPVVIFMAANSGNALWPWSLVSVVIYPLLAAPSLSMAIRRLHDVNRSGWWLLLLLVFGYFILLYWFCQPSVAAVDEQAEVFA